MEYLTTNLNDTIGYQPNVVLDLSVLRENSKDSKIDFLKASISELSSVIVTDMIESVKTDLSSVKIENETSSK